MIHLKGVDQLVPGLEIEKGGMKQQDYWPLSFITIMNLRPVNVDIAGAFIGVFFAKVRQTYLR